MSTLAHRLAVGTASIVAGLALVAPTAIAGLGSATVGAAQATDAPEDDFTANWTRAQALKVNNDPTNTKPLIPEDFPIMTEEVWIWDTWPLTNLATDVVTFRGWHVIFSLTAPRDIFFSDRHWVARIGFFYSRDAKTWTYGGDLFPEGRSLGAREWAGSTLRLTGNRVQAFYTASGHDGGGADPTDTLQRLATSTGTIHADDERVWFTGFRNHQIIAEADGEFYQTQEQSEVGPIIYAFRDPWVFDDPQDGKTYMLFEGNNGGVAGTHTCDPHEVGPVPPGHVVPDDARFYTGNIGLARATDRSLRHWKLLPPLLSAECTNQQTERPHMVIQDGDYYMFTISHMFTFAPGLTGPDGVYGFLGDALRSDYKPLNGSALVLGNPPEAPLQQYSEYVMPNWLVESFIDTIPTADGGVVFGGTLAPTLRLEVDGFNTYFVETLDYGFIPATS